MWRKICFDFGFRQYELGIVRQAAEVRHWRSAAQLSRQLLPIHRFTGSIFPRFNTYFCGNNTNNVFAEVDIAATVSLPDAFVGAAA